LNSRYSALTAKLDKRMSHHYQFSVGHALSKLETTTADGTRFDDSFISHDLQLSYGVKLHGRVRLEATAQVFNAFNISNLLGPAGLPSSPIGGTLPTLSALPAGFSSCDGSLRDSSGNPVLAGVSRLPNGNLITTNFGSFGAVRPWIPTGTGLPRAAQFGIRVTF
jgi:hypothetical protein